MTDAEIIDRIDGIGTRVEHAVAQFGERVVRLETRADGVDRDQAALQVRQTETEKAQHAGALRLAYMAGAAAVLTVVFSELVKAGLAAAGLR